MIYSNQDLTSKKREFDFGVIHQVALGEEGRGRKIMALTCPQDTHIKEGLNADISIGLTKSGKPRIIKNTDNKMFLLLSAAGGYTRRGNGTIKVLTSKVNNFKVLARGNGADGDAGRIGYWDCMLIEAPITNAIVRVRTSGSGYGTPSDLYVIQDGNVYHCTLSTLIECCEALNIDIPCEITEEGFGNDWTTL